ncbi:MAG: ATP-binding protein [Clostridiales bacterium]|jgi:hypothetical protein|nr:ATP-binding protein [Clostridiales bacterium]
MKRIIIVLGHYGSGKTEISVNLALKLAESNKKVALVDLDIANVYFRSRERKQLLVDRGIEVHSNAFQFDIAADLPALSPTIRKPLEDKTYNTVVDVGGDDSGARILNQFIKYFDNDETQILCVINANRPETSTVEGALDHIYKIQKEIGLNVSGLVNNTHLLRETQISDIIKGRELCNQISEILNVPLVYNCCVESLCEEASDSLDNIFPIKLYMRPTWM